MIILKQAFPFDLISAMQDNGLAEKMFLKVFTSSFVKIFESLENSITTFLSFSR